MTTQVRSGPEDRSHLVIENNVLKQTAVQAFTLPVLVFFQIVSGNIRRVERRVAFQNQYKPIQIKTPNTKKYLKTDNDKLF